MREERLRGNSACQRSEVGEESFISGTKCRLLGWQCRRQEGLETGAGMPHACSVGLLRIFVLILRAGEANTGFSAEDQPDHPVFQRRIAAFEVIFEVSKKRYQVGSRVCGTGPQRDFWAGN